MNPKSFVQLLGFTLKERIMTNRKNIKLYVTFYRSFCFASILISLACAFLFFGRGTVLFTPLFWFKITTIALLYYYINGYKSKEFFFYKNLGIGKKALWIFAISLDLIIYFIVIIIGINLHGKYT